jgi:hypothetical protein
LQTIPSTERSAATQFPPSPLKGHLQWSNLFWTSNVFVLVYLKRMVIVDLLVRLGREPDFTPRPIINFLVIFGI